MSFLVCFRLLQDDLVAFADAVDAANVDLDSYLDLDGADAGSGVGASVASDEVAEDALEIPVFVDPSFSGPAIAAGRGGGRGAYCTCGTLSEGTASVVGMVGVLVIPCSAYIRVPSSRCIAQKFYCMKTRIV